MTKAELIAIIEVILARTPAGVLYCPPLKRSVVVALLALLKGNQDANQ